MIEKTIKMSMMYDFYNQLLTEKQRQIVDLYYNQDLSLGEIAEGLKISRQAVYDMLKRTEKLLYQYEEKLQLIRLFQSRNKEIIQILDKLVSLEKAIDSDYTREEIAQGLKEIKRAIEAYLDY